MSFTTATALAPRSAPKSLSKDATTVKAQPAAPSPGRFQHPRMTEIAQRRAATSFTAQNVQTISLNAALLLASFVGGGYVHSMYVVILVHA